MPISDPSAKPSYQEIAVITDGRDITRGYLPDDAWLVDVRRDPLGQHSLYTQIEEQILRDWQVETCLEQRILAHTSCEVEVIAASRDKPDQKARDFIEEQLKAISWDSISQKMHRAIFWGRKEAEVLYSRDGSLITLDDRLGGIKVRDGRRFRYSVQGDLLLITAQNWRGEVLPPNKFWVATYGGETDDDPNGLGLWWYLKFPCLFKRGGIKSWLKFLDKFAQPTVVGSYESGSATKEDKDALGAAVRAFASSTGVTIPKSTMIELIEASRSGTGDYSVLNQVMEEAISKIIVGQTMTSDSGSSEAQANVHLDVRQDLVKADSDLINESANNTWVKWLCNWNFPDAKPPRIWRKVDQEEDLNARVNRDKTLFDMGFTLKSESLSDIYGDDYEPKPQDQATDPLAGLAGVLGGNGPGAKITPNGASGDQSQQSFAEFIEFLEAQFDPVEFAAKQCKNGWPCGGSCISKNKKCNSRLTGQAATYAQWAQQQAQATGTTGGGAVAATPATPAQPGQAAGAGAPQSPAANPSPQNQPSAIGPDLPIHSRSRWTDMLDLARDYRLNTAGVSNTRTAYYRLISNHFQSSILPERAKVSQQIAQGSLDLSKQKLNDLQDLAIKVGADSSMIFGPKNQKQTWINAISQAIQPRTAPASPVTPAQPQNAVQPKPTKAKASPGKLGYRPPVNRPRTDVDDIAEAIQNNDFDSIIQKSTAVYKRAQDFAANYVDPSRGPAPFDFYNAIRPGNHPTPDPILTELWKGLDHGGKPEVVSQSAMDAEIAGGATAVYRGTSTSHASFLARFDRFKNGDAEAGHGIYGHGHYVAIAPSTSKQRQHAFQVGQQYGAGVMRMTLKPGVNEVSASAARKDLRRFQSDWTQYVATQRLNLAGNLKALRSFNDKARRAEAIMWGDESGGLSGRFASLRGADIINPSAYDKSYRVLLNRSVVKIQASEATKA